MSESEYTDADEQVSPELAAALQAREESISLVYGIRQRIRDLESALAAANASIDQLKLKGQRI